MYTRINNRLIQLHRVPANFVHGHAYIMYNTHFRQTPDSNKSLLFRRQIYSQIFILAELGLKQGRELQDFIF